MTEQGKETDRLVQVSLVNHIRHGLVVILVDKDGEYYMLTKDMLYSGKSVDNIKNPRNKGTWVNPEGRFYYYYLFLNFVILKKIINFKIYKFSFFVSSSHK